MRKRKGGYFADGTDMRSGSQMAAFALLTLAQEGGCDCETGYPPERFNAATQRYFARDITEFESSPRPAT